jgi:predicted nucleic acid-binding protein
VILYLDTSSLVKLYLDEAHSRVVRDWAEAAEAVATARIAYPETLSAFIRRWSQGDLRDDELELARESLDASWPTLILLPLNERRAGALVVDHFLRGFDAVHLAAAHDLFGSFRQEDVVFSSFDNALLRAAGATGLSFLHPGISSGFVMEEPFDSYGGR